MDKIILTILLCTGVPLSKRQRLLRLPSSLLLNPTQPINWVRQALLLSCLSLTAQAADIVKTNNNDALNLGSSWSGLAVPGTNDWAVYTQTAAILTNALGVDLSWNGIVLTSNTKAWVISTGNTLTIGSGGIDMATAGNNFTINAAIALGATQTWTVAATRTLTVDGVISGSAGNTLVKDGAGTLTLATNNTFSGGVTVNAGTLNITAGAQQTINVALGSGALTLNNGAVLNTGNRILTNAVVIPAGQSATIIGNTTLNGPLSGSGSLFHTNSGGFTLILAEDNGGFSGSITNTSTLSLSHRNALGSGTLYMKDDSGIHSTLSAQIDLLGYNAITNDIILINTVLLGLSGRIGNFELKGVISDDGGLIANHPYVTVTLSGANTYTGATDIAFGGLIINGSMQSPLITAASNTMLSGTGTVQAVIMNSGSTLEIGGTTPGTMNFKGNLTLTSGSTNIMKVFSTNSYDILRGAGTNALFVNGTVLLDFSDDVTIEEGDHFDVTRLYRNWSNVTQPTETTFAATGLPGSFNMDTSTVASNGMVTIVPSSAAPPVLPDQFPIAMTYHLPSGATNVSDLVKYEPVQIMGSSGNGDFSMLRNYFPKKMLLLQDAWGGTITIGMQSAFPGHWLMKTGTKLAADFSPTDTVMHVDNYKMLATSQTAVNNNLNNNNAFIMIYGLDADGRPDWSRAEHLKLTAVNTANGTITVERAQHGSLPLAFTNGQAVIARHMMFWVNNPGGQWQLNFSLQCPRGGPLNLTAAEWFAREIKKLIDESGADGVEFDVARWQWGAINSNNMDCDNNLVSDYGYIDGVQSFGLGGQVFVRELRKLLGPGKIIQMDSNDAVGQQRGWKYVNGCQLESFPNANNFSTFSEAFLHLRQYRDSIETLPNFSYPYVKTPTTAFENLYDNGANIDWHFRVGFAAALLTGMPSPFSSITDPNFDPGEFDPDATNTVGTSSGGVFYKWDEFVGGDLNDWQWLGKPLGVAVQVPDNLGSSNLLAATVWQWEVETNFMAVCLANSREYSAAMSALASVTNILPIDTAHYTGTQIPKTLTFGTRLEMAGGSPVLATNQEYTIEFEAAGNDHWDYAGQSFDKVPRMLAILTPQNDKVLSVLVNSNWYSYRLSFFVTTNTPLVFGASEQIGDVKIRNIKLYQGGAERWTREFEHGRVYLNMTKTPWTVNVGTGTVQRLVGIQATNVNNGAVENGILTVPSWDAVFLRTWTVDAWKSAYFTSNQLTDSAVSGDLADPDGDGINNLQEYTAGTNPQDAQSKFLVAGGVGRTQQVQLNWSSVSGRVYDVYWSTNLLNSFVPLQTNIDQSVYTSPVSGNTDSGFYKIKVRHR